MDTNRISGSVILDLDLRIVETALSSVAMFQEDVEILHLQHWVVKTMSSSPRESLRSDEKIIQVPAAAPLRLGL